MTGNIKTLTPIGELERMPTGVPGLDTILGGGLPRNRVTLIKGTPGTGKTTLGLQMLVAGATQYNEPGVLLTFEQVPSQVFADCASLGWNLRELHDQHRVRVIFVGPDEVLENPGRQANRLLVNVADLVEDHGVRRILIDSISHLGAIFSKEEARAGFLKFMLELRNLGLTPIGTAEMAPDVGLAGIDAYLVDTLIALEREPAGRTGVTRRTLEVVKSRGHAHLGGAHPFEIGARGITVFPHADPAPAEPATAGTPAELLSSGVAGLDGMLGGGYLPGSVVLVAGLSGTYKSAFAAHFLTGAASADPAPALWVSFNERAEDLSRAFAGRHPDVAGAIAAGRLQLLELLPGRAPVQKIAAQIEEAVEAAGIHRVAIDSVAELTAGLPPEAIHEDLRWLLRRLRQRGVTTLLIQRLARVTGRNPLSEIEYPELADTIVYLGLVEIESRLEKVISVLKHRGGQVEGDLRAIRATAEGLVVSDRFVGLSGVLAGSPLGHRKARIEEIFQPLLVVRDFLRLAADPTLDPARRAAVLENLHGETDRVIDLLSRYFDQPLRPAAPPPADKEGGRP